MNQPQPVNMIAPRLTHPEFQYVRSEATDIRKTFSRFAPLEQYAPAAARDSSTGGTK